jgi:peptidoglycan/xylan/chitin deacetylase (PgdA/CDA1 family)
VSRPYTALMYHAIGEADGLPESEDYTVPERLFRRHLLALEGLGCQSISLASLVAGEPFLPDGSGPGVLLTFDDGFETVLTRGAEIVAESGYAAVVFITSDKLGQEGYLDEDQVRILLGMGVAVGAHGRTHAYLSDLPLTELRRELVEPRERLSRLVGYDVQLLSAPGGRVDARVLDEARRAGYQHVYGSRPGRIKSASQPLPRYSVTTALRPHALEKLVAGNRRAVLRAKARYAALKLPKKVLGNERYDKLRARLLARSRQP